MVNPSNEKTLIYPTLIILSQSSNAMRKGAAFYTTNCCRACWKNCSTNLEESLLHREYVVCSMVLSAVVLLVKNTFQTKI